VGSAEVEMRPMVESRGMNLIVQIAPDLPPVFVDARQIGHVFSNLITNAAAHSKPGDEILIAAQPQEGSVRFSVTDHGPAIADKSELTACSIWDRSFISFFLRSGKGFLHETKHPHRR
jgi:signal transduction histidine kinase